MCTVAVVSIIGIGFTINFMHQAGSTGCNRGFIEKKI